MKQLCAVFLSIFVSMVFADIGLSEDMLELMKMLHTTCVKETGVDESLIEKAKQGDFIPDQKLKCYMKCTFKESGIMDETGAIDLTPLSEILPDEYKTSWQKSAEICSKETEHLEDICDKSFGVLKCAYEYDPSHFTMA